MSSFHKPKLYRTLDGCCICKAKSSSSRWKFNSKKSLFYIILLPFFSGSLQVPSTRTTSENVFTCPSRDEARSATRACCWSSGSRSCRSARADTGVTWWTPGPGPGSRTLSGSAGVRAAGSGASRRSTCTGGSPPPARQRVTPSLRSAASRSQVT